MKSDSRGGFPAPRSWLFVPGSRLELLEKATASGADAVIVDLEDSVSPNDKGRARAALKRIHPQPLPIFVRVNAPKSEYFVEDLASIPITHISGVMIPKLETPDQVDLALHNLRGVVPVIGLIETARGIYHLSEISAHPSVQQLAFGSIDLGLDVGCGAESFTLKMARSSLVIASRAANLLAPIDGVTLSTDEELVRSDAAVARANGFSGKLCIHPRQVASTNLAFMPTDEEVIWAKEVVSASKNSSLGAFMLNGEMVDKPVIERAKRIISLAGV